MSSRGSETRFFPCAGTPGGGVWKGYSRLPVICPHGLYVHDWISLPCKIYGLYVHKCWAAKPPRISSYMSRICAILVCGRWANQANQVICPGCQRFSPTNALPVTCPQRLYVHKSAHSRPLPVICPGHITGSLLYSISLILDLRDHLDFWPG